MRPRLAQLHPSGASDNDVATYNASTGLWEPAAPSGGTPSGPAGGDLAGTYPDPTIGAAGMEAIRDMLATALVQGTGITITVDDGADTITIAATGGSSSGELLMQDGVSSPPVPIETEDGTDWLYEG